MIKDIKNSDTSDSRVIIICLVLLIGVFIVDSLTPLGVAGGVPYVIVVLISLWSHRPKLTIYIAIGATVLTLLGLYSSPYGGEFWKVIVNRLLALFVIWAAAILSLQWKAMYVEKERALSKVKILSGLLPICALCKNIRDDKGYWNQIESYIRDHTDADFSHGLCPDCVKKLYPDIDLNDGK